MHKQVLISVVMITYGHEKFIREAIEGVLMQKVDFDLELVIADDNSPDNTEQVVLDIASSHPNGKWIKYTKHKKNKGMMPNFIWTLEQCKGKYIAMCDGDDYWTDPNKLQKQVDFLDANPDMTLCAHNACIFENNTVRRASVVEQFTILTKKELISHNPIMTASVVFRNNLIDIPKWLSESPFGDYALYFLAIMKGRIGILPDYMCVYRKHDGGVHSVLHNKRGGMIKVWIDHIRFYNYIKNKLHGLDHEDIVELNKTLLKCYSNLLNEYKEQHKIIHYYVLKLKLFLSIKFNIQLSNL
jgi:glycosyltransferase involved in cell wall biosynthesis